MEAVVLFDYEKQQDDELDLTVGMTIQNVIQVSGCGDGIILLGVGVA